jgi:hypothetical protein
MAKTWDEQAEELSSAKRAIYTAYVNANRPPRDTRRAELRGVDQEVLDKEWRAWYKKLNDVKAEAFRRATR